MKPSPIKKILKWSAIIFLSLVIVLGIHIYWVTRPHAPTETTQFMARIDFKQKINQGDADKYATWLNHQKGVDHVLVNSSTGIAVFSFYPVQTNGDAVVNNFRSNFNVDVQRYVPTKEQMSGACPVGGDTGFSFIKFFKNIFS